MRRALIKRKILNAGAIGISYFKLIPDLFRLGGGSIVLDCGANVGHIAKLFSLTGATVIAFEPDPVAYQKLLHRCRSRKNITCVRKGVWDKDAIIQLFSHEDSKGNEASFTVGSSIIAGKININTEKAQSIEVIDLVSYIQNSGKKIDLVKLDVEGAEIEILKKVIATDAYKLFDRMYVETHETKIPSQAKELEWIKQEMKNRGIKNIKLNWV
ncbi:MAG: FkbM family methyltransferase [Bacteroidota bacterium]